MKRLSVSFLILISFLYCTKDSGSYADITEFSSFYNYRINELKIINSNLNLDTTCATTKSEKNTTDFRLQNSDPIEHTVQLIATEDTYISSNNQAITHNFGSCDKIILNQSPSQNIIGIQRGLVKFDFGSLPANATITNAKLKMQVIGGDDELVTVEVFKVLENWQEGPIGCDGSFGPGASWFLCSGLESWSTQGGVYSSNSYASADIQTQQKYSWNLTNLVLEWTSSIAENYGILLRETSSPLLRGEKIFASRQHSNNSFHPYLEITYTTPYVPMNLSYTSTKETCPSSDDGTIDLTVTGGEPPYRYNWSNDGFYDPDNDPEDLNRLDFGIYSVVVKDSRNNMEILQTLITMDNSGPDTDNDGKSNDCDIDDDNDGITDAKESYPNNDKDGDGIDNSLDLDSDSDGILDIIEAGGQDNNYDGRVDNSFDTDKDGLADIYEPNGLKPPDYDNDQKPDYLDIDSDGDGIIDLIEVQETSASLIYPNDSDTDNDGIDDVFDVDCKPCSSVSGQPFSPLDTDQDGDPDYLDEDSDDDGESDFIEAYDKNNDGIADINSGKFDSDNDGLLNSMDNYSGLNTIKNVTNNKQGASDFPDNDLGFSECDWREVACDQRSEALAPKGCSTLVNELVCVRDGWYYYSMSKNSSDLYIAVEKFPSEPGSNTSNFTLSAQLVVTQNSGSPSGVFQATDEENGRATFVMGRYANITVTSGSLNGYVNLKFYFNSNEHAALNGKMNNWESRCGLEQGDARNRWFAMEQGDFIPDSFTLKATGIIGATEIIPLEDDYSINISSATFRLFELTGIGLAGSVGANTVVLPVELIAFEAKTQNDVVELNWCTASEINNDYFTLYRSDGGDNWERLKVVMGNGTIQEECEYSIKDLNPLPGLSYYRLDQTDFDGATRELGIIGENRQVTHKIKVYPNPADKTITIGNNKDLIYCEYTILNINGQRVLDGNLISELTKINVETLTPGIYYIEVEGSGLIKQFKILIRRP